MKGAPYSFFVQWHLTERCNLRCRHCYQTVATPDLSREELVGVLDNLKGAFAGWATDQGVELSPTFQLSGGEPLVRKDLLDIIGTVRDSGFAVSLMTNGTLVSEKSAAQFRSAGVSDIQVSLDGLRPTHDALRGKGSFAMALAGIHRLVSAGIDTNINVTVSRLNVSETAELVQLARALEVSAIAFSRLVPTGRGSSLSDQSLSPAQLAGFYAGLRAIQDDGATVVTSRDPLSAVAGLDAELPETQAPFAGCAAGMFGVTITAGGAVMPCRRMDLPIGNLRTDSFREIWAESPVLWALRTLESYHGDCRDCRFWAACRGCRAVALAHARAGGNEDYLGSDPQCPFYSKSRIRGTE